MTMDGGYSDRLLQIDPSEVRILFLLFNDSIQSQHRIRVILRAPSVNREMESLGYVL